jgi:CheY-like chemotaxis protein
MPNIFLVQWDKAGAAERTAVLRREGWTVTSEIEDGGRAYKKIREDPPAAVVIDLAKKPSHGRQVAQALRDVKACRGIPIVFVDASEDAESATKVDNAVFATSATLAKTIARISRRADSGPVGTPRRRRS